MEKYRKFDDARVGVNPFVPAKAKELGFVKKYLKPVSIYLIHNLIFTKSAHSSPYRSSLSFSSSSRFPLSSCFSS